MAREQKVREKRARKQEKKDDRKLAALDQTAGVEGVEGSEDALPDDETVIE